MKVATAHLGLGAILPQIVFAGQAKQWEQQREIFEKRAASNITNNINSGNVNSNNVNSGNSKFSSIFLDNVVRCERLQGLFRET